MNDWLSEKHREQGVWNFGDMLSAPVVNWMLEKRGINPDREVGATKHLFALGSILFAGWQDKTVWGSGAIRDTLPGAREVWRGRILHRLWQRIDVRAVRGPRTREMLRKLWIRCPEVYGDPAILLPLFYRPKVGTVRDYNLIPHYTNRDWMLSDPHVVEIETDDWQRTVDEICSARRNISSSLHGIIVSEAYGIPAVLLRPDEDARKPNTDLFKYDDYYFGTGRMRYPIARGIDEALAIEPPPLPDLQAQQEGLMRAFPYDLWED